MGGPGSTRWNDHTRALRVEDAVALDLLDPAVKRLVRAPEATGVMEWCRPGTGCPVARLEYRLSPPEADGSRVLVLGLDGDPTAPKQVIHLEGRRKKPPFQHVR